jgi:hypothetical protein
LVEQEFGTCRCGGTPADAKLNGGIASSTVLLLEGSAQWRRKDADWAISDYRSMTGRPEDSAAFELTVDG